MRYGEADAARQNMRLAVRHRLKVDLLRPRLKCLTAGSRDKAKKLKEVIGHLGSADAKIQMFAPQNAWDIK